MYGRKLQPVLAAADGVVTSVVFEDASTGRVEMTITDTAGTSYHYAGFNDDNPGTDDGEAPPALRLTALAQVGTAVRAGQVIGFLGDSDREPINTTVAPASDVTADGTTGDDAPTDPAPRHRRWSTSRVWPHLRLTITALDGTPIDADGPVVQALFRQTCTVGIGLWSVPPNPAVFDGPIGDIEVPAGDLSGHWMITASGQVQATGLAAVDLSDARLPVVAHRAVRAVRRRQHRVAARLQRSHHAVGRDLDRDHARDRGCPPRRFAVPAPAVITVER